LIRNSLAIVFLVALILSACSPAKATPKTDVNVQTAVAELMQQTASAAASQQQEAEAQPTATVEAQAASPVVAKDVESSLAIAGDLPEGVIANEVTTTIDSRFIVLPPAVKALRQVFTRELDQKEVGSVSIFQYNTKEEADQAFSQLVGMVGNNSHAVPEIGDSSMFVSASVSILDYFFTSGDVAFTRCNSTVHIRLEYRTNEFDETGAQLFNYAKKLDERLTPLLCSQ
jgi:hypothetical protein